MTLKADTIDTSGQAAHEQCGYCHEYDGNSKMSSTPRIAGQTAAYIIKQLKDFRSGKRESEMQATAELLNDDDIKAVARYFSQQKVRQKKHHVLAVNQRKRAEKIFYKGDQSRDLQSCVSCHGSKAVGEGSVPRLAGQHEKYLYQQLMAFKSGTRKNDTQGGMQLVSALLDEQEIKALVGFIARLLPNNKSVVAKSVGSEQK